MSARLEEKLADVQLVAGRPEGYVGNSTAPEGMLALMVERMEEGHWRAGVEDWDEVPHMEAAREELADCGNYISGLVRRGKISLGEGRVLVVHLGDVWCLMEGYVRENAEHGTRNAE